MLFLATYLFFSFSATKMPSFVFPVALIAFLAVGHLFFHLLKLIHSGKIQKLAEVILLLVLIFIFWNFEEIQNTYKRKETNEYIKVQLRNALIFQEIEPIVPPDAVLFNVAGYYVDAMAFTGHTAYPCFPDSQVLDSLTKLNRKAVVFAGENEFPEFLARDTTVVLMPIVIKGY